MFHAVGIQIGCFEIYRVPFACRVLEIYGGCLRVVFYSGCDVGFSGQYAVFI